MRITRRGGEGFGGPPVARLIVAAVLLMFGLGAIVVAAAGAHPSALAQYGPSRVDRAAPLIAPASSAIRRTGGAG